MFYDGMPGEHVVDSAENAIAMANRYNRKVWMRFNGLTVIVNKRLSVRHVVSTWRHMLDAGCIRYRKSPKAKIEQEERTAGIVAAQYQIDALMLNPPTSKEDAMRWLAKWVPLSDDIGVNRHSSKVAGFLNGLGFSADQHVGDPDFESKTATRMKRIEYVGGQVIAMLETLGFVHPMIGDFADHLC